MYEPRVLSAFSGIGAQDAVARWLLGGRQVGYIDVEPKCQELLRHRIDDGLLPNAPIYGDIKLFNSEGYARANQGMVDVFIGGPPCQAFSLAGLRKGEEDPRNMWPATLATIRAILPRYVFLENVPGLLFDPYVRTIFGSLAEMGYDAEWCMLGADQLGAPHRRRRFWLLANSEGNGWPWPVCSDPANGAQTLWGRSLESKGSLDPRILVFNEFEKRMGEPAVFRVSHGRTPAVDRLAGAGNAWVCGVAAEALRLLHAQGS